MYLEDEVTSKWLCLLEVLLLITSNQHGHICEWLMLFREMFQLIFDEWLHLYIDNLWLHNRQEANLRSDRVYLCSVVNLRHAEVRSRKQQMSLVNLQPSMFPTEPPHTITGNLKTTSWQLRPGVPQDLTWGDPGSVLYLCYKGLMMRFQYKT